MMDDERRYDETEIEEIFRRAAEAREGSPRALEGGAGGMTLRELQEIGAEVGFSHAAVARAAAAMDTAPLKSGKTRTLGLPVGVDHTVALPRTLTDEEWERLVARLRNTFNARGHVEVMGRLRQWSNGNLRVSVEPTVSGHQLRLHTHKGNLRPLVGVSSVLLLTALLMTMVSLMTGRAFDVMGMAILAMTGIGVGGTTLVQLPGWAERRARQMEEIADTVTGWMALPPPAE